MNRRNTGAVLLAVSLLVIAAGCKRRAPVQPTPPPPPPAAQPAPPKPAIALFVVEPSTVQEGQSATLRWNVTNATNISIDQNIGSVQATGTRQVFASATTRYTLTATGQGGTASATATLTVTQPPPPPPAPAASKPSLTSVLATEVHDIYFDFDKYDVRSGPGATACTNSECRQDAQAILNANATALRRILSEFSDAVITIEGHCDERGSAEYNLGLGDRRATAVREYLAALGVDVSRLRMVSYGKERPQCSEADESCWQRNRRAHFAATASASYDWGAEMTLALAEPSR